MRRKHELVQLIRTARNQLDGADRALLNLSRGPDVEISHLQTKTKELLAIQARRLRRRPSGVYGLEGLVAALRSTTVPGVDLFVYSANGEVTSIAVTPNGVVLGCVTGRDARQ